MNVEDLKNLPPGEYSIPVIAMHPWAVPAIFAAIFLPVAAIMLGSSVGSAWEESARLEAVAACIEAGHEIKSCKEALR